MPRPEYAQLARFVFVYPHDSRNFWTAVEMAVERTQFMKINFFGMPMCQTCQARLKLCYLCTLLATQQGHTYKSFLHDGAPDTSAATTSHTLKMSSCPR